LQSSEKIKTFLRYIFATPQRKDDNLNMRAWFIFYVLYMAIVCVISQWAFTRYFEGNQAWAQTVWYLGLYVFYLSLACTYVPLNTGIAVLFLASPTGGLTVLSPFWRIIAVAGLGAMATGVAHTNEYHMIAYLLRLGKVYKIKETRVYRWAEKYFKLWPFMLLVVFNIVPIPADPPRWLAIMSGYPLPKFFLAQWVGRFLRYTALAVVAEYLQLTLMQIIGICILLVAISIAGVVVQRFRRQKVEVTRVEEATV